MSVTLREIARVTGLSVPTVGNVLGNSPHRHSAATREIVLKAARELGYQPNASARAMQSGRFGCIALILSRSRTRTHSYLPVGFLEGIEDELSLRDMHLSVSRLGDVEFHSPNFVPKVLRQATADGIIVHYTHELPQAMQDLLKQSKSPVVGTNAKLESHCVYLDDFGGSFEATRRLIEMGHRRVAFLVFLSAVSSKGESSSERLMQAHYSVSDRLKGYCCAMKNAGLSPMVVEEAMMVGHSEFPGVATRLLSGAEPPSAVIGYSDRETIPLLHAALSLGLSVPRDLSIVHFGADHGWFLGQVINVIKLPVEQMGREAVRMVLEILDSQGAECGARALRYGVESGVSAFPDSVRSVTV